jgi:uncharacterized cofD-like protein
MTQPGETDSYAVSDHIKSIFRHAGDEVIDYVIVNNGGVEEGLQGKYKEEESHMVNVDIDVINSMNVKIIDGDLINIKNGFIRHNSEKLASIIIETIMEKTLLYDKKKIIEYFYLSERLKEKRNRE